MTAAQVRAFAPQSIAELNETMRDLAASGEVLTIAGGGTKAGWGNPVRDAGASVSTAALNRIVDYAPEDLVVTVEAGTTLAALQAELGKHGQRLAFDPPHADAATIGGLVSTADFGQRRARYGGIRDLIIGVQFVRADGLLVRGGGKVVKNVAGFDLPKILTGSFGTLGVIASATFRLHPVPETARMVCARELTGARVRDAALALAERRLEPAVLLAVRDGEGYTLATVFEGFASGVDDQCAQAQEALGAAGFDAEAVSPEERARVHAAHGRARTQGDVRLQFAAPPACIATVEHEALAPLTALLGDPVAAVYPSLGFAFAGGDVRDADATAAAIRRARETIERMGGSLTLREMPAVLRTGVDPWGTPPASFPLMERLKDNFDPLRRLNRGRFVGGL